MSLLDSGGDFSRAQHIVNMTRLYTLPSQAELTQGITTIDH